MLQDLNLSTGTLRFSQIFENPCQNTWRYRLVFSPLLIIEYISRGIGAPVLTNISPMTLWADSLYVTFTLWVIAVLFLYGQSVLSLLTICTVYFANLYCLCFQYVLYFYLVHWTTLYILIAHLNTSESPSSSRPFDTGSLTTSSSLKTISLTNEL